MAMECYYNQDILQKKLAQGLEQSQKQRSNNSQAVQTSTNTQENLAGNTVFSIMSVYSSLHQRSQSVTFLLFCTRGEK